MPLNNPGTSLDDLVQNEIPTGAINGTNSVYATANDFETGSLVVYLNGVRQAEGSDEDYTITSGNSFTFNDPPKGSPGNPDKVSVDYKIA